MTQQWAKMIMRKAFEDYCLLLSLVLFFFGTAVIVFSLLSTEFAGGRNIYRAGIFTDFTIYYLVRHEPARAMTGGPFNS